MRANIRFGTYLFIVGLLGFAGLRSFLWGPLLGKIGGWFGLVMAAIGLGLVVFEVALARQAARGPTNPWEPAVARAVALSSEGNWSEAIGAFETAMTRAGPAPSRLRAAERIGTFLVDNEKPLEAAPFLRQALQLRTQLYGVTRPAAVVPAASRLAEALHSQGDLAGAAAAYQVALDTLARVSTSSADLPPASIAAARFATQTGDFPHAEVLLKRALDSATGLGSVKVARLARSSLVATYKAAGRYSEAVLLNEVALKDAGSLEARENAALHKQHAELLELAGRPDDAARHRRLAQTLERLAESS